MAIKRAERHPAATMGWMYLQPREAGLLAHGPSMIPADPHQSGQDPSFTEWAITETRRFVRNDPYYQQQIADRIKWLERELNLAEQSRNAAESDVQRLKNTINEVRSLADNP